MKQQIKVVSSFSDDGFRLYGRKFIDSFLKHWPEEIELHIYYEDTKPTITDKRLKYHKLFKVPGCLPTIKALGTFPVARGEINGKREYRLDAFRFCRKMFAQVDAATQYEGLLLWVDADTEFFEDIPEDWIRDMFKAPPEDPELAGIQGGTFMIYMGRPDWHSCASFVGWDCSHIHNAMFWKTYFELIVTGRFFMLPEWHDSFWLDFLREQLGFEAINVLDGKPVGKGPVNVFNILFGDWGKHAKGNLKYQQQGPQRYAQLIDIVEKLQPKVVIEVGTWNGHRAREMAAVNPGMKYVGFDLFESATDETDEHEKNVKPHHYAQEVGKMLGEAGVKAMLCAGNTNETFPQFLENYPDKKADLIYIDGGHAVETIQSDFDCALKAIAFGGTIVFDDYYEGMSDEDLDKWGCNRVIERSGLAFEVLPIGDPVKGGGITKMVVMKAHQTEGGGLGGPY